MQLDTLLEQSRTNHYKLLVITDNNQQHEKIINALKDKGWTSYNVNENILKITEDIPESKVKVRIGEEIKNWVKSLPDKVIFYNTNILYSPELGKLNPVGAFRYSSRDKECIVILEGHLSGSRIQYSEYKKEDHVQIDVIEFITVKMENIDV